MTSDSGQSVDDIANAITFGSVFDEPNFDEPNSFAQRNKQLDNIESKEISTKSSPKKFQAVQYSCMSWHQVLYTWCVPAYTNGGGRGR